MTAIERTEEYLESLRDQAVYAQKILSAFNESREQLLSLRSIDYSDPRVMESKAGSSLERKYCAVESLHNECLEAWERKFQGEKEFQNLIEPLPWCQRVALFWYYLAGLSNEKCAEKANTCSRTMARWRQKGIYNLARIMFPEEFQESTFGG